MGKPIQYPHFMDQGHTWRLGNKKHHPDKPAVITLDRTDYAEEWWLRGKRHRAFGGPAYLSKRFNLYHNRWEIEVQMWYFKGMLHCTTGPAVIIGDLEEYWYMGAQFTELEWMMYAQGMSPFPKDLEMRDQLELNNHPVETMHG